MEFTYGKIVNRSAESKPSDDNPDHFHFSERHMQAMWADQKFFHSLTTEAGHEITVISPGIWNTGPGPDFTKAHLMIGGREVRGDVELNVNQADWTDQDRQSDPRYSHVVLHIAMWPTPSSTPCTTKKGVEIDIAFLRPAMTVSPLRALKLIDLDLYPYAQYGCGGKCSEELFQHLEDEEVKGILMGAALTRLQQKWQSLSIRTPRLDQRIGAGLASGLGGKDNAESFLQLYTYLCEQKIEDRDTRLATALGCCQFFDEAHFARWEQSEYYQRLCDRWQAIKTDEHPRFRLQLAGLRPLNHPTRQLAYLSELAADPSTRHLHTNVERCWHSYREPLTLLSALADLIPKYSLNHWQYHYTFETQPQKKPLSLLTRDKRAEMVTSALLPYLCDLVPEVPEEQDRLQALLESMPGDVTRKSEYLSQRFFANGRHADLLTQLPYQQGAFQIHQDFCIHHPADCRGCPFVERVNRQLSAQVSCGENVSLKI